VNDFIEHFRGGKLVTRIYKGKCSIDRFVLIAAPRAVLRAVVYTKYPRALIHPARFLQIASCVVALLFETRRIRKRDLSRLFIQKKVSLKSRLNIFICKQKCKKRQWLRSSCCFRKLPIFSLLTLLMNGPLALPRHPMLCKWTALKCLTSVVVDDWLLAIYCFIII